MPTKHPIAPPASYVTPAAVGFADAAGDLTLVSHANPLPVGQPQGAAAAPPLSGTANGTQIVGPYAPVPGRPVHLQLGGEWTGTVRLQRSSDDGATLSDVTAGGLPWAVFDGPANEAVWQESEDGVTLHLAIALIDGTLTYRVSQ